MKNNKFTSAADRRWQKRYETIVQRKEMYWDLDQERKKKKAERKLMYKRDVELDFSKLCDKHLPAVVCNTRDKREHLLREVRRIGSNISTVPGENIHMYDNQSVYVFLGQHPKWESVVQVNYRTALMANCDIFSYEDLLPPPDYGDIEYTSELSMLFV